MARSTQPDPVAVLRGHHAEVQALDFLDSEHTLLTGDAEGEVRAWDLRDLRPLTMRRAHPVSGGVINLKAFGRDGQHFLVSQGKDMAFYIWQMESDLHLPSEPLHTIQKLACSFCRFSLLPPPGALPQGSTATQGQATPQGACSTHSHISREEAASGGHGSAGAACASESAPEPPTATGACHAEPTPLPAAAVDAVPAQSSGQPAATLWDGCLEHDCAPTCPPPHLLALPADDNSTLEVWCGGCGRQVARLGQPCTSGQKLGMCTSLKLFRAPYGATCLAAGYEAGWLAVWAVRGGVDVAQPPLAARQLHEEPVLALDIDGTGAGGVTAGADTRLIFFKLDFAAEAVAAGDAGVKIRVRRVVELKAAGVNDVVIRGDGRIVATAGWDSRVRVFKYKTGEPLAVLKYHQSAVAAVRFSPETNMLASASRDGTVALWDIYQRQPGS